MTPALWLLLVLLLAGHLLFFVGLYNRLHAKGWPPRLIELLSWVLKVVAPIVPVGFAVDWSTVSVNPTLLDHPLWAAYGCVCLLALAATVASRLNDTLRQRALSVVKLHRSLQRRRGAGPAAEHRGLGRLLTKLPGNEILHVELTEKTLQIPRLPQPLVGLSIAHLSDLHLTGRIGRPYFEEVVRLTNELEADLIVLTGDLIESATCCSWIDSTLARLTARIGVFFVLGNHDKKLGAARVRRLLSAAGLIDLGGRWQFVDFQGERILLAGNELPWIKPAPDLPETTDAALRILLAHTPDQIGFARRHGFDLMLAGHTHGGQIALPLVGPILSPSRYGVRYAAGTFYEPPTVLHVSRGISGEMPLRWNCPPEATKLILTAPHSGSAEVLTASLATSPG